MSELPSGWEKVNLSDIAHVESGIGFPLNYQGEKAGDLGFFKVGDISRAVAQFGGQLKNAQHYVSYAVASELRGKPVLAGATVFAKIGEAIRLHRRAYVVEDCLIDNNVMAVKAFDSRSDRFLFRFMQTKDISELARSTTVPSLRKGDIEGLHVPLAPLNEQKRIADKLDAVLARVDACRDRLDRIPVILKHFRQSVLAAATSGYLTEEFRNGENYSPKQVHFSELVQDSLVGLVRSSVEQFETGNDLTPYLKMNNISEGWGVNLMNVVQVRCSPQEAERYALKVGDWLFNTRNSTELVGKSCVWKGDHFVFNNNILRVRFNDSVVPDFIEIWFRSPTGRRNLNLVKSATTSVAAIYQRSLMAQMLEIPAVEEQTEIVRRVEALFAYADRIEARFAAARAHVNKLTPSMLGKAFRGELVPQDPNDEPASVLLERIRATSLVKEKQTKIPRKAHMEKHNTETVKAIIQQMPLKRFSFDELRSRVTTDYESLKDIVFALLSESEPLLRQVFDEKAQAMCLEKVGR